MKKIVLLLICLFSFIALGSVSLKAKSYSDLDYIHKYYVTVDPNKDGTLNIDVYVEWEVLDSSSEGPLEWVIIGVPNYHVKDIKPLTDNIKKAKYDSDDGSFIRIDFKKKYYRGDIVTFEFSWTQSYMYHLNGDNVYYDYNPGYFPEIKVEECILKWNKNNIISVNGGSSSGYIEDGDYYVWNSPLDYSEALKANVTYSKNSFDELSEKKQYTDASVNPIEVLIVITCIILVFSLIVFVAYRSSRNADPYAYERGFIGGSYYHCYHWWYFGRTPHYYGNGKDSKGAKIVNPTPPSSGSGGGYHGGSGCACACACACAGGGRAGCSRKDFYHTNLESDKVKKLIREEN